MARIAGVNIPNHQHVKIALTAIYGIGNSTSQKICNELGIENSIKLKDISEAQLEQIREKVAKYTVLADLLGPFLVRAFVLVRCPLTGKPLLCRNPR